MNLSDNFSEKSKTSDSTMSSNTKPIPINKNIRDNYIISRYDNSPIFKSIDNNDFIIVESPQEKYCHSDPINSSIMGNIRYISMSIDMLKNSFNYMNDYKSI